MGSSSLKRQVLVLIGLYVVSYVLLLFNHGIFWDDWLWFNLSPGLLLQESSQVGYPVLGPLHIWLNHIGVESYRWITFLSYLVAALVLLGTLRNIPKINSDKPLYLVLIFALFPVNTARITTITAHYGVCYALFFTGLFLFSEFTRRQSTSLRIASLVLIAVAAFFISSFLFFCILPPALFLYMDDRAPSSLLAALNRLKKIPDFIALPIVVFAVKSLFFKPYGYYSGYNTISLHLILSSPRHIASSFNTSFIGSVARAARLAVSSWGVAAIAAVLTLAITWVLRYVNSAPRPLHESAAGETERSWHKDQRLAIKPYRKSLFHLSFGLILYILACLPYSAVGKYVGPWNWDSRNQLLLPLACAWLVVFGLDLILSRYSGAKVVAISALIALFVCMDVQSLAQFQKDSYKQQSLLAHFESDPEIRRGVSFLVDDETPNLDADMRTYSFYEYSGMFYTLFGQETRFAIRTDQIDTFPVLKGKGQFSPPYMLGEYNGMLPDEIIKITYGPNKLDARELVGLMVDERIHPERYEHEVWDLTQVTTNKLER